MQKSLTHGKYGRSEYFFTNIDHYLVESSWMVFAIAQIVSSNEHHYCENYEIENRNKTSLQWMQYQIAEQV